MDRKCEQLEELGVDLTSVMERFMGNEALYVKFLGRFVEDESFQNIQIQWKRGNIKEAFKEAHTLKGLLLNLGLENVMKSVMPITEQLRQGELEGIEELLEQARREYEILLNIIGENT